MKPPSARLARFLMNLAPCIRASGGRIVTLSDDFKHLRVRLKLSLLTRNLVGTLYGGSLYSSIDPFYMLMLMRILGPDYVVWDKSATIRFKRPARVTLYADFRFDDQTLANIREQVARDGEGNFTWTVALTDASGTVYADCDKVLYVAKKDFYEEKLRQRERAMTARPTGPA
jgi:acyl-coenzyme A thioesterase PaaI-like protein